MAWRYRRRLSECPNYLRRPVISDSFVTDERLLQIIVGMFQRGECNKIRFANKAITEFGSRTCLTTSQSHKPPSTHHADLISCEPRRRRQRQARVR